MDTLVKFFTDTATLAIFDPEIVASLDHDAPDWWCCDFGKLPEMQSGLISLVSLGADGVYQARLTDEGLTPDEHDYAAEMIRGLGVEVRSGCLFAGPGECLPEGTPLTDDDWRRGVRVDMPTGKYDVDVYSIYWHVSPKWWRDDGCAPENAPADFVVAFRSRAGVRPGLGGDPRFSGVCDSFLFDSSSRVVGPQPGMLLTTTVRKNVSGRLILKDCGPRSYRAALTDYSRVAWKDTIRLRVLSVDRERQMLIGEFVEKVPKSQCG